MNTSDVDSKSHIHKMNDEWKAQKLPFLCKFICHNLQHFFIIIYYKLFENIKLRGRKRRKETTIAISTAYVYILCLMKYGELIFPYKHNLIVISSYYNFYKKKRGGLSFNKL